MQSEEVSFQSAFERGQLQIQHRHVPVQSCPSEPIVIFKETLELFKSSQLHFICKLLFFFFLQKTVTKKVYRGMKLKIQ